MLRSDRPPGEETALRDVGAVPRFRDAPRLSWASWKDASSRHSVIVEGPTVVIGSASHAGVSVRDPTISRLHAELEVRDDGVWVRDLDSRNGTFVDGVRVSGAR